jgi:hypothetical protein
MMLKIGVTVRGHEYLALFSMPWIRGCTRCSLTMGAVKMFMLTGFVSKVDLLSVPPDVIPPQMQDDPDRPPQGELALDIQEEVIQENFQRSRGA